MHINVQKHFTIFLFLFRAVNEPTRARKVNKPSSKGLLFTDEAADMIPNIEHLTSIGKNDNEVQKFILNAEGESENFNKKKLFYKHGYITR